MSGGSFQDPLQGVRLEGIQTRILAQGEEVVIERASATTPNGGTLCGVRTSATCARCRLSGRDPHSGQPRPARLKRDHAGDRRSFTRIFGRPRRASACQRARRYRLARRRRAGPHPRHLAARSRAPSMSTRQRPRPPASRLTRRRKRVESENPPSMRISTSPSPRRTASLSAGAASMQNSAAISGSGARWRSPSRSAPLRCDAGA